MYKCQTSLTQVLVMIVWVVHNQHSRLVLIIFILVMFTIFVITIIITALPPNEDGVEQFPKQQKLQVNFPFKRFLFVLFLAFKT